MKVLNIKMELLLDVVFGNGMSVPGGEDIAVLCDEYGFPYYKGGTFKGVFREELERYIEWTNGDRSLVDELLGVSGSAESETGKLVFSDFVLSDYVKKTMLEEIGEGNKELVTAALTNIRAFTKMSEEGTVAAGSLRTLRCVNKGLCFYSQIICDDKHCELVREVLSLIKWIGSMRNRGFGKILVEVVE